MPRIPLPLRERRLSFSPVARVTVLVCTNISPAVSCSPIISSRTCRMSRRLSIVKVGRRKDSRLCGERMPWWSTATGPRGICSTAILTRWRRLLQEGVGLACLHFAVEVPQGKAGDAFLRWLGGYFELNWSVNPMWRPEFNQLPDHPITRGVQSFSIEDEWYFHMRFRPQLAGVTPILSAVAPADRNWPDGPRSGNAAVRQAIDRGEPQHVAWACERADGGRGFGFTGGHWHRNWGDDNFRTVVLNGIAWTAGAEIPAKVVSVVKHQPPRNWKRIRTEAEAPEVDRGTSGKASKRGDCRQSRRACRRPRLPAYPLPRKKQNGKPRLTATGHCERRCCRIRAAAALSNAEIAGRRVGAKRASADATKPCIAARVRRQQCDRTARPFTRLCP